MRSNPSRYIIIVFIVPLLCVISAALSFRLLQEKMPPPHVSNSRGFNEKARWLKNNLSGRCDVLIIGSSMALNNINSEGLKTLYPGEAIINAASWGINSEDSYSMLKIMIPLCHPKTIILPTNYVDLTSARNKDIAWSRFEEFLRGDPVELIYLRGFELFSFISDLRHQDDGAGKGRGIYGSLMFDDTGTVNLSCESFEINQRRWDGYKFDNFSPTKIRPEAIDAIISIAKIANHINSQLIVITTPIRQVAERTVYPDILAGLWRQVRMRIEEEKGIYIRVSGVDGFDDKLFADFQHLNECGAKKLTNILTQNIRLQRSH